MKNVIIADVCSLTYEGYLYGHSEMVAKQLKDNLEEQYNIVIAGGEAYLNCFDPKELLVLPYHIERSEQKNSILAKMVSKLHEYINTKKVFNTDSDIIIFQCYNQFSIYLSLLLGNNKKKVYIIQYQPGKRHTLDSFMFTLAKRNISGIIATSKEAAQFYNKNPIVVPDYFPPKGTNNKKCSEFYQYDVAVVGTISRWKNYEDLIECFNDTGVRVLIVGKFRDNDYYKKICGLAKSNIIVINKYLDSDEYNRCIDNSRYIALPYKKEYENKSSGVLLEALYKYKPVIVPRLNSFSSVEKYNMGIIYNKSISEIVDLVTDKEFYDIYKKNISKFIDDMRIKADELCRYLDGYTQS